MTIDTSCITLQYFIILLPIFHLMLAKHSIGHPTPFVKRGRGVKLSQFLQESSKNCLQSGKLLDWVGLV